MRMLIKTLWFLKRCQNRKIPCFGSLCADPGLKKALGQNRAVEKISRLRVLCYDCSYTLWSNKNENVFCNIWLFLRNAILRLNFDDVFKTKVISQPLTKLLTWSRRTTSSGVGWSILFWKRRQNQIVKLRFAETIKSLKECPVFASITPLSCITPLSSITSSPKPQLSWITPGVIEEKTGYCIFCCMCEQFSNINECH